MTPMGLRMGDVTVDVAAVTKIFLASLFEIDFRVGRTEEAALVRCRFRAVLDCCFGVK